MTDIMIDGLNPAGTLAGTENVPVSQAGVTVRTTINALTAFAVALATAAAQTYANQAAASAATIAGTIANIYDPTYEIVFVYDDPEESIFCGVPASTGLWQLAIDETTGLNSLRRIYDPDYMYLVVFNDAEESIALGVKQSGAVVLGNNVDVVGSIATNAANTAANTASINALNSTTAQTIQGSGSTFAAMWTPKNSGAATVTNSNTQPSGFPVVYNYDPTLFQSYGGIADTTSAYVYMRSTPLPPSGGNLGTGNQYCGRHAFITDAPQFVIFAQGGTTTHMRIWIDGVPIGAPFTQSVAYGGNTYYTVNIGSAKSTGRRIDVELDFALGLVQAGMISLPSGYRIWKPTTTKRTILIMGDSYTGVTGASSGMMGYSYLLGRMLGGMDISIISQGDGGTGYRMGFLNGTQQDTYGLTDSGGNLNPFNASDPRRISFINNTNPDLIVIALGINDNGLSGVQAAALNCYQRLRAAANLATTPILVLGAWPGSTGPSNSIKTTETAIQAAVNQIADPLIRFQPVSTDPSPWINGTGHLNAKTGDGIADWAIGGVSGDDTTHPTDDGHREIARRLKRAVNDMVPHFFMAA